MSAKLATKAPKEAVTKDTVTKDTKVVEKVVEKVEEAVEKKPRRTKKVEPPVTPAPAAQATQATQAAPEAVSAASGSQDVDTLSEEDGDESKRRVTPTRESVEAELNSLVDTVDQEVQRLREASGKQKGVKFLRVLGKRLKNLRTHTLRVMKQKKSGRTKTTTNSGFLKPVKISKDLAKFTGWNEDELRSRVDVTKYICNYIKEHNLQNPTDRRQIRVEDDVKLRKLLNFDAKKEKTPLTYYSLQSHLKSHFTPVESK